MADVVEKDQSAQVQADASVEEEVEQSSNEDLREKFREEGDGEEESLTVKSEKALDDDQDRRNPQYIPKGGSFYEHDNRTSLEDVENEDPQEFEKKKKVWKESKESERWLHDCYNESEQTPKTTQEIIDTYGYDIRNEEAAPRARRRRKYGRGPDKYERKWEDEQAYLVKQNTPNRRGRRRNFGMGKDEFPPLPNQKNDASPTKSPQRTAWKNPEMPPKNKIPNHDKPVGNSPVHKGEPNYNKSSGFSNKKTMAYPNKKINEDDIKPFRTDANKWKNNIKSLRNEDFPNPIKTQLIRHSEPPFSKNSSPNKNLSKDSDMSMLAEGFSQMGFRNKYSTKDNKPKLNEIPEDHKSEPELDSPANRQNPKRYSKIRKGFTGYFPPDEIVDLDPSEIKHRQQQEVQQQQANQQHVNLTQQSMNMQNVMRRYAGSYNGNAGYIPTRPIISGIPQQGISPQTIHQQTLSPQGIPQQALSPQVPGLQTIELQQTPIPPQPNFVPPPMFIDMDPYYATSDVLASHTSYPSFSGNQGNELYQSSSGITYYSPECQSTGQVRPPPARRPKAAIPIVPPPE